MTDLKKYIDSIEFKLKDFESTRQKYQGYKQEKFKAFILDWEIDINAHLESLRLDLIQQIINHMANPIELKRKQLVIDISKGDIRSLKTMINGLTYHTNKKFIEGLSVCDNENELKSFTILFYLTYYDKINGIMKDALKEYLNFITD